MSTSLLHKTKLKAFLSYCQSKGLQTRDPRGDYQVAQIQPRGSRDWYCIYERLDSTEHYSVDCRLDAFVRQFIRDTK